MQTRTWAVLFLIGILPLSPSPLTALLPQKAAEPESTSSSFFRHPRYLLASVICHLQNQLLRRREVLYWWLYHKLVLCPANTDFNSGFELIHLIFTLRWLVKTMMWWLIIDFSVKYGEFKKAYMYLYGETGNEFSVWEAKLTAFVTVHKEGGETDLAGGKWTALDPAFTVKRKQNKEVKRKQT